MLMRKKEDSIDSVVRQGYMVKGLDGREEFVDQSELSLNGTGSISMDELAKYMNKKENQYRKKGSFITFPRIVLSLLLAMFITCEVVAIKHVFWIEGSEFYRAFFLYALANFFIFGGAFGLYALSQVDDSFK